MTTLRGEGAYTDGRRPDWVEFVDDITADLARRDFTVNAIAIDPARRPGHRPVRRARRPRSAASCARSATRASASPRTACACCARRASSRRSSSTLDPRHEAAIAPTLDTFRKVAAERVRDEWVKAMKARAAVARVRGDARDGHPRRHVPRAPRGRRHRAEQVARVRRLAPRHGVHGRLRAPTRSCASPRSSTTSASRGRAPGRTRRTDYTFYDHDRVGAEIAEPIAARLRFSNDERARIVALVRHHLFHYSDEWTDAAVRRWIRRVGPDRVDDLYVLNEADVRAKGRDFDGRPGGARGAQGARRAGARARAPRSRRAT